MYLTGETLQTNDKVVRADAHATNYTATKHAKHRYTMHWAVTNRAGCIATFQNGARNASATLFADANGIVQFMDTDHIPWSDGNYYSNQRTISFETDGGYYVNGVRKKPDPETHENVAQMIALLEARYGSNAQIVRKLDTTDPKKMGLFGHGELSATECPGPTDVEWITNRANEIIASGYYLDPNAKPPMTIETVVIEKTWKDDAEVVNEKLELARDSQMYQIDSKVGEGSYKEGTKLDIAASYHQDGTEYYITKWSWDRDIKKGFRAKDFITKTSTTSWLDYVTDITGSALTFNKDTHLYEIMTGNKVKDYDKGTSFLGEYLYDGPKGKFYISQYSYDAKIMNGVLVADTTLEVGGAEVPVDIVDEMAEVKKRLDVEESKSISDTKKLNALQGQYDELKAQLIASLEVNNSNLIKIGNQEAFIKDLQNKIEDNSVGDAETQAAINALTEAMDGHWHPGQADTHGEEHSQDQKGDDESTTTTTTGSTTTTTSPAVTNTTTTASGIISGGGSSNTAAGATTPTATQSVGVNENDDGGTDSTAASSDGQDVDGSGDGETSTGYNWSTEAFFTGFVKQNIVQAIAAFIAWSGLGPIVSTVTGVEAADEATIAMGLLNAIVLFLRTQISKLSK